MIGLTISSLVSNLKVQYEQRRFYIEEDEDSIWQLLYPKHFVSLSLHHVKEREKGRIEEIASSMSRGFTYNIKLFQNIKTSSTNDDSLDFDKFISNVLLDTSPQHEGMQRSNVILINGAPGMGKTTLCKEIAYRWAKGNNLLKCIDLIFLLFLRDPKLKTVDAIENLIHYFYDFEPSSFETAQVCTKLLSNCKNVMIIMDGYDEFSDTSGNSLITRIIKRKVLSHCKLIITSRPFTSESLQSRADVTVEIRGFNEQSKEGYINNELEGEPDKIRKLQLCLQSYSDINSVCYIPIIMSVLVFIIKRSDELPEDQVQLYNHFISFVISRSRQRLENSSSKVLPLDELPQIYQDYLLRLCQFAYEHIRNKTIVFTEEDINKVCSSFNLGASQLYGLGLLHYTKCTEFISNKLTTRVYCNFVHQSIQEYLAAYYISSLEPYKQFLLLKNTFLVNNYLNTWIMFAKINKSKMFDFQLMLMYSCMQKFSEETRSSLQLLFKNMFKNGCDFRFCANDDEVLCFQVSSQCVSENQSRSKHSVAYLSLGNITENTGHLLIYLIYCSAWDIFCKEIISNDYAITMMLVANDILMGCKISQQQLNNGLAVNKLLQGIMFINCHVTSDMTNMISSYVEANHNMKLLLIRRSTIDTLQLSISSLTHLALEDINFSAVIINKLAELIKRNSLLEFVSLANNDLQTFAVILLQALKELINLKLLNLSYNYMGEAAAEHVADVINNNTSIQALILSSNKLQLSTVKILKALANVSDLKMLYLNENNMTSDVAKDLVRVIKHNPCLEKLGLADNDLEVSAVVVLQALQGIRKLKLLNLSNNNMTSDVENDLGGVIKSNSCLEELYLSGNNLMSDVIDVLQALQGNSKLKILYLNNNPMTDGVAEDLAEVIKSNPCLEELGLADNDLKSSADVVLQALQGVTKLKKLNLGNNNMTSEIAEDLAEVIKSNPCLEHLGLANNDLQSSADVVLQALQGVTKLKTLNLDNNNMTSKVAEDLAGVIKSNPCLEQLGLANNDLKSSADVVLRALQGITKLRALGLDNNNMTSKVAEDLAEVIKSNHCLEQLGLANNDLKSSADVVLRALQGVTKLKAFDLGNNNITNEVAEDLAEAIKSNPCLEQLELANNDLKSSADVVLQALRKNSKLKILCLHNNQMTGQVAKDLALVIRSNPCLEQLGLADNDLNLSAVVVLQALQGVTKLEVLNLENNNMTSDVSEDLATVINSHPCLKELYLSGNDLMSGTIDVLQALEKFNAQNITFA